LKDVISQKMSFLYIGYPDIGIKNALVDRLIGIDPDHHPHFSFIVCSSKNLIRFGSTDKQQGCFTYFGIGKFPISAMFGPVTLFSPLSKLV
jgi:hypothetical protein